MSLTSHQLPSFHHHLLILLLLSFFLQSSSSPPENNDKSFPAILPEPERPLESPFRTFHDDIPTFSDNLSSLKEQEIECDRLCSEYQIVPTIYQRLQSLLPNATYLKWTKYNCHTFSVACERRVILPTLSMNYRPRRLSWKDKCSKIFSQKDQLVVFAVASKPMAYYGMLVATAIKYDLRLVTVGWNVKRNETLPKNYFFGYKIISVYNILSNCYSRNFISNTTIVMVVDGTDVIFQKGSKYILKQFRTMNHSIVFGGEAPRNLISDFANEKYLKQIEDSLLRKGKEIQKKDFAMLLNFPLLREKDVLFLFLNSGCFIGRVGNLLEFYKYWVNPPYFKFRTSFSGLRAVKDQPPRVIYPIKTLWDSRNNLNSSSLWPNAYFRRDQFTASHMYLDGVADSGVDMEGKIFLSTFMGGSAGLAQYLRMDSRNRTVSNLTDTTPAVLHFAGESKFLQCLSDYVKTFMTKTELDHLFSDHKDWRDRLVMLDANLDLVSQSLVTPRLIKNWIPRYPMRCHGAAVKDERYRFRGHFN
jgi:hypothetical protein